MISSINVGGTFRILDEASPQLVKIADALKDLQAQIDKTKDSFKLLADSTFGGLTGRIDEVAGSLEKVQGASGEIAGNLDRAMTTVAGSITAVGDSIGSLTGKIAALNRELVATGTDSAKVARTAEPAAAGGYGGGGRAALLHRSSGGGGHGIHTEGVHAGPFGFGGGDLAAAGGLFSIWESLKASADLQEVQENLRISGVSPAEIAKATQEAYSIGAQYGLTATSVLQGINEIRNPLNKGKTADEGVEDALRHADTLARAAVVLRDQGKDRNGDVGRELYDLVKSAEFRNAIGDKDFDKAVGSMVAADVATGGIVTPRAWLQLSQYARSALPGFSDDYLYKIMPELAQEFRGAPAGTALASFYQQFIAGAMKTQGLRLLDQLDLIDESKVEFDKNGRIVRAHPGFYKDDSLMKSSPLEGMASLVDAMKAHGITSESDERDWISQIIGNRNAAQLGMTLGFQAPRLLRGAQGIENTWGLGASSDELLKNNPFDQWSKFTSSLTNLGAEIGTDLMPAATDAAHGLTTVAQALAAVFKAFPFLGILGQSGFKLGGNAADAAADIGTHTSLGALWQWITGGGGASAAESDKVWGDFKSQFKPGDLSNVPDLGPVPNAGDSGSPLNPLNWFHKTSYESGGALGAATAQTVDIVASVVNLANVGGGYPGKGGFMNADYETGDDDAGGGGLGGGLHSGGGYTVLGGGRSFGGGGIGSGGLGPGSGGRGGGAPGIAYSITSMGAAGFTQAQYDAFRAGIRDIEGGHYGIMGGAGGRYAGAYQMGPNEIAQSAAELGISPAGFLSNPALQEKLFERYTLDHYKLLMRDPMFAGLSNKDKLAVLAAGQLGVGAAERYLHGGGMADSNGTPTSAWANAVKHRLAAMRDYAPTTPTVAADYPDRGFHSGTVHAAALNAASSSGGEHAVHVHTAVNLDGKRVAHSVQKHVVRANSQIYGPSMHDKLGSLSTPDAGYQTER